MFIVTDLTRFPNKSTVCTALIEVETGRCVRPLPYFQYSLMREHKIVPGAKFSGSFTPKPNLGAPHLEDCDYHDLKYFGPGTKSEFRQVLLNSVQPDVSNGFKYQLDAGEKVIPTGKGGPVSIVTIGVSPSEIQIVQDNYNASKIKLHFRDASGREFRFTPITDLGFFDHAKAHHEAGDLAKLNAHLQSSKEIFLRVGLSREYTSPDNRSGYWIQVNGIYSFPSKLDVVRGYS